MHKSRKAKNMNNDLYVHFQKVSKTACNDMAWYTCRNTTLDVVQSLLNRHVHPLYYHTLDMVEPWIGTTPR